MRAFLGGRGLPRDEFALGGAGGSADSNTPVVLLLEDGEVFTPADYISLGFTNFDAWCVGASGGRGGDASDLVKWRVTKAQEVMPGDIWEAYLVAAESYDAWRPGYLYVAYLAPSDTPPGPYDHRDTDWYDSYGNHFFGSGPGGLYRYWLTPRQNAEWLNPTHMGTVTNYIEPILYNSPFIGGGGGGGGLHVVSGVLADLPSSVTAEVGQQGSDGAAGQAFQAAPWDSSYYWQPELYNREGLRIGGGGSQAIWEWANRFPTIRPLLDPPAEGSSGGASSFGDICQASGGKGGKPAVQWAGAIRQQYAHGGEGGAGAQVTPGGGAAGAISSGPGKDGTWDGDIGKGGGGGRGGVELHQFYNPATGNVTVPFVPATEGGRGSLNFADTSVWGARGPLGTYLRALRTFLYTDTDGPRGNILNLPSAVDTLIPKPVNPGSGGGARIPGGRKYGSRAAGYSHDGAVLLRLFKLD